MESSEDELPLPTTASQKRRMTARLDIWDHFDRGDAKYMKTNCRVATCKGCVKAGGKVVDIRGEKSYLLKHLLSCVHVPQSIKKAYKSTESEPATPAKRTAATNGTSAKRTSNQGSLLGFLDRPLTTVEEAQFERLLADTFLDCNISFRYVCFSSFVAKSPCSFFNAQIF